MTGWARGGSNSFKKEGTLPQNGMHEGCASHFALAAGLSGRRPARPAGLLLRGLGPCSCAPVACCGPWTGQTGCAGWGCAFVPIAFPPQAGETASQPCRRPGKKAAGAHTAPRPNQPEAARWALPETPDLHAPTTHRGWAGRSGSTWRPDADERTLPRRQPSTCRPERAHGRLQADEIPRR